MSNKENGGRAHEPTLRELTAELDGVKFLLEEKIDSLRREYLEVHRRFEERFAATAEMTNLALQSSKEAVMKAEVATEKRFESVNEFRQTLSDQSKDFMQRREYISSHQALIDKVDLMKEVFTKELQSLREYKSQMGGEKTAVTSAHAQSNWTLGMLIAVCLSLFAAVISVFGIVMRYVNLVKP